MTLKAKYNELELNTLLGNTGLGSGDLKVQMLDPIFDKFTKNSADSAVPIIEEQPSFGKVLTEKTDLRYKFEGVNLS